MVSNFFALLLGAVLLMSQVQARAEMYRINEYGTDQEFLLALDQLHIKDARTGEEKLHDIPLQANRAALAAQARERKRESGEDASLVLYPSNKPRNEANARVLTRKVAAQLKPEANAELIAKAIGSRQPKALGFAPGFYVFESTEVDGALEMAKALDDLPDVISASPLLGRKRFKRLEPNDPLYPQQWHLRNTGQNAGAIGVDLNVTNVWNTYHGEGISIGIVDDGLQHSHPDLVANSNTSIDWDYRDDDDDSFPLLTEDAHGTAVAGVAAAAGNNSQGVAGVAYNSTLVGVRLIGGFITDADEAAALSHSNQVIHIYNNSWGPADDGLTKGDAGPLLLQALRHGAETGRSGLGSIYVWAAGNGGAVEDNANYDTYANSIYTIAVGALNDRGARANYSERGACLMVCAPAGGDAARPQATRTTDLTNDFGYNITGASDLSDRNYTRLFDGTSAAAPMVSGVVALLLQSKPTLGWRDVQEILMRSARRATPSNIEWFSNNAGFFFNLNFGAGLANAGGAVALAQNWRNLGPQTNIVLTQTMSTPIPDEIPVGVDVTFQVTNINLRVEHVVVTVTATHPYRGDLEIRLTSPHGTVSWLSELHDDPGDNYLNHPFMSVFHWGETAMGTWTLNVADRALQDTGTLTSVKLEIYGTAPTNPLLRDFEYLPNGDFAFLVDGHAGRTNIIQASTDLTGWTNIGIVNHTNGSYRFTDTTMGTSAHRFYRVLVP